jgi:hypothetical protein
LPLFPRVAPAEQQGFRCAANLGEVNRAPFEVLLWVTVLAALLSALLLTATDGSLADTGSITGALDTLIDAAPPSAAPNQPAPPSGTGRDAGG